VSPELAKDLAQAVYTRILEGDDAAREDEATRAALGELAALVASPLTIGWPDTSSAPGGPLNENATGALAGLNASADSLPKGPRSAAVGVDPACWVPLPDLIYAGALTFPARDKDGCAP